MMQRNSSKRGDSLFDMSASSCPSFGVVLMVFSHLSLSYSHLPTPTAHIYIDLTKPLFICPGAKQSIPIAGVGAGVEADLFCGTAAGPQ
jgi:hypothetical protein